MWRCYWRCRSLLLDCPLYHQSRTQTIDLLPDDAKFDVSVLLFGRQNKTLNENRNILTSVERFICLSGRFAWHWLIDWLIDWVLVLLASLIFLSTCISRIHFLTCIFMYYFVYSEGFWTIALRLWHTRTRAQALAYTYTCAHAYTESLTCPSTWQHASTCALYLTLWCWMLSRLFRFSKPTAVRDLPRVHCLLFIFVYCCLILFFPSFHILTQYWTVNLFLMYKV